MFGSFARWHVDVPAPADTLPARTILTTVDTAVQRACGLPPGPVHLNCQFRCGACGEGVRMRGRGGGAKQACCS